MYIRFPRGTDGPVVLRLWEGPKPGEQDRLSVQAAQAGWEWGCPLGLAGQRWCEGEDGNRASQCPAKTRLRVCEQV